MDNIVTKKCTKCKAEKGVAEFYKYRHWCKSCFSDNNKKWRLANLEKRRTDNKKWQIENAERVKEQKKKRYLEDPKKNINRTNVWRLENSEKFKATCKKWYLANSGKVKDAKKKRYHANPEKVKEINKKWQLANIEKVKENIKNWRKSNPEKIRIYNHNRRSKFKGTYTVKEWTDLCEQYDNKCLKCGEEKKMTVDHVMPISRGGTNYINNIQPLCLTCNLIKNAKAIDYRR